MGATRGQTEQVALLVNDDGPWANGLSALRAALRVQFARVITIVPAADATGAGSSSSWASGVSVLPLTNDRSAPVYACTGMPVDCVRVGLLGPLASDAAVVVSGVNAGANLGSHVWYSGTVAAVLEAARLGVHGLAVSQQLQQGHFAFVDPPEDATPALYQATAQAAALVAASLAELTEQDNPVVLNMNSPAKLDTRSFAVTSLDGHEVRRGSLRPLVEAGGAAQYLVYGDKDEEPGYRPTMRIGSDRWALESGHHSLSMLSPELLGSCPPMPADFGHCLERVERDGFRRILHGN